MIELAVEEPSELEHENAELRRKITEIEASRSWRLTAPLRALGWFFRAASAPAKSEVAPPAPEQTEYPPSRPNDPSPSEPSHDVDSPRSGYPAWLAKRASSEADAEIAKAEAAAWPEPPLISVIMPVHDPSPTVLEEAIQSVRAQFYELWNLILVDDGSSSGDVRTILAQAAAADDRIILIELETSLGVVAATNVGIAAATGRFLAFMDHDDVLACNALHDMAKDAVAFPEAKLLFSDEDRLEDGRRTDPHFKTDWNVELMRGQNAVNHLCVVETDTVRQLGGLRLGFDGSQDHDLVLRVTDLVGPSAIRHVPAILYHWRRSRGSLSETQVATCAAAGRRAISDHLQRHGLFAEVLPHPLVPTWHRTRYRLPVKPKVSVLVPTRDQAELLRRCTKSVLEMTDYAQLELLIIDNGSTEPEALELLKSLSRDPRARIIRDNRSFNYSSLNNQAAMQAQGEILVLLNNDVEALHSEWLEELVSFAVQPSVGAVGAKLFYPDGRIQHCGVALGIRDGVGDHFHIGEPGEILGFMGRAVLAQDVSAVTGACLAVRRDAYLAVGGLDEINLPVAFNDVDLCLKLAEIGKRNVWTPFSRLIHHTSASRGSDEHLDQVERARREVDYMKKRWAMAIANERHYSRHFSRGNANFQLA